MSNTAIATDARDRLFHDVAALVGMDRKTTSPGERASADVISARLRETGCAAIRSDEFRTTASWVPPHLAHVGLAIAAALTPATTARLAAAAIAASYELEASSRSQWIRHLLPRRSGTSVSARVPTSGPRRCTVVLVAHHDTAHTGWLWHRHAVAASQARARRTGRALPSHMIPLMGMAAAAVPSRRTRRMAALTLATTGALMVQSMRSPSTPGANDNASGVAVALEVARRLVADPPDGIEVLVVFPGAEEVGNAGMHAWLRESASDLDPSTTLVINLDAVGSNGPLAIAEREGLSTRMNIDHVDWAADIARSADVDLQRVGIPNATDAVVTSHAGFPTVSLASCEDGWISHLHRSSDTIENVNWGTVTDAVMLTEALTRSWMREAVHD